MQKHIFKIIHEHAGTLAPKLYVASTFVQYLLLSQLVDWNPHKPICRQHTQELEERNLQSNTMLTKKHLKKFTHKQNHDGMIKQIYQSVVEH